MPWWAYLLLDVAIVLGAVALVARAYWRGWTDIRAFLSRLQAVLADVPRVRR